MTGSQQFSSASAGPRSCATLRRGVSLVELMISMLILAIVCIAWLEIIGIQSARKEARRREAVERLVGMMDAFMYCYANTPPSVADYYLSGLKPLSFATDPAKAVHAMFDGNISPIGYRLRVLEDKPSHDASLFVGWNSISKKKEDFMA